jgi:predicted ferric reductase
MDFHVHTYVSLLVMATLLTHNIIGKNDQLIMYAYKLFNDVEQNNNTTKNEALVMVFALHKFKLYLLGNKFLFYLGQRLSHDLRRITRCLLLFLKYDFIVVYKLGKTHVNAYALSKLLDTMEFTRFPKQTIDASLFFT